MKTSIKKKYTPPANFTCTNEAIDWLKENRGIRNEWKYPMVTIFVDEQRLECKSHKGAIKHLESFSSGCIYKAFRNAGGGLTLEVLG